MSRGPILLGCNAIPATVNPLLRHPVFAWIGLRPVLGQHTAAEHAALKRWATQRSSLVEIGVAEGASAIVLRQAMSPSGTLWLIDPFHLSRTRIINATKRAARRVVGESKKGSVVWIEKFSFDAVSHWHTAIDFLFIDGDHSEAGVNQDWEEWHRFVVPGGVVAFHDASTFSGGWPRDDWGPVRLVNRLFRGQGLAQWTIVDEVDSLVVIKRIKTNCESKVG
jgi:predicted O-methyltransferase YrrM